MQKKSFLFLILLSLLSSCMTVPSDVPFTDTPKVTKRLTITPEDLPIDEINNELLIPSVSPTENNIATPTLSPTGKTQNLFRMEGNGSIWMITWNASHFMVLDLNAGSLQKVSKSSICYEYLIPETTQVYCNANKEAYLKDILSDERVYLPEVVGEANWVGFSPNGRYLYYGQTPCYEQEDEESDCLYSIYSIDLISFKNQLLAENINSDAWNEIPVLSADGMHLALGISLGIQDVRVFEVMQGTSKLQQIGFDNPPATWDLAWSPTKSHLIYGAVDQIVLGSTPKYIYFIDFESDAEKLLSEAPNGNYYQSFVFQNVWSPDGKIIALSTGPEPYLCVITIPEGDQTCYSVTKDIDEITGFAWSPDSKKIAFTTGSLGTRDGELWILSLSDGAIQRTLIDIQNPISIFWR